MLKKKQMEILELSYSINEMKEVVESIDKDLLERLTIEEIDKL